MKGLFTGLYLDEDVSVLVAQLVQSHGFDALTTLEADQLGNSDEQPLAFAVSRSRTLLTHNRVDFEALARHYFCHRTHALWYHRGRAPLTPRDCTQAVDYHEQS